jgi:hypothetical protein
VAVPHPVAPRVGLNPINSSVIAVAIAVLAMCALDRRLPWRAIHSETCAEPVTGSFKWS